MKTRVKNVVKAVDGALETSAVDEARAALHQAEKVIAKAAGRGTMHPKSASRKISRLTRKVNALAAS